MQEMEINLKDLAKRIFQQWRLLLIGMIVGAILGIVVGGVMSVQKAAAAEQVLEEQMQNENAATTEGTESTEEPIVVPEVTFFSVKNIVIGVMLGAFLVVAYVAVAYVFSGKLRCTYDMTQGFGVSVIGVLTCDNKKQRKFAACDDMIDKWFYEGKKLPRKTNIQIISTDIALAAQKYEVENLYLTGNVSEDVVAPIEKCIKIYRNDEINVCFDELAIYSPSGLKNLLCADGVVLVEQIGKSTFGDIEKELEYCKRYNIPVLGCVVAE